MKECEPQLKKKLNYHIKNLLRQLFIIIMHKDKKRKMIHLKKDL